MTNHETSGDGFTEMNRQRWQEMNDLNAVLDDDYSRSFDASERRDTAAGPRPASSFTPYEVTVTPGEVGIAALGAMPRHSLRPIQDDTIGALIARNLRDGKPITDMHRPIPSDRPPIAPPFCYED